MQKSEISMIHKLFIYKRLCSHCAGIHLALGLPLYLRTVTLPTSGDWQRGGNHEAGES